MMWVISHFDRKIINIIKSIDERAYICEVLFIHLGLKTLELNIREKDV